MGVIVKNLFVESYFTHRSPNTRRRLLSFSPILGGSGAFQTRSKGSAGKRLPFLASATAGLHHPGLNPKGFATAAGLVGIRIRKLEPPPDHGIAVVQHQAVEIEEAFAVTDNFEAFVVEHFVMFRNFADVLKVHQVGHAGATALANPHP